MKQEELPPLDIELELEHNLNDVDLKTEEVEKKPKKKSRLQIKPCQKGKCCLHDVTTKITKQRELVKGPNSAWALFVKDHRNANESSIQANKRLSEEWKQASTETREEYQLRAKKDRYRFEADLRALNIDDKKLYKKYVHQKRKKARQSPKLSGYTLFVKENRKMIVLAHPEFQFKDIGKELGKQWKELSDEKRLYYNQTAMEYKKNAQQLQDD